VTELISAVESITQWAQLRSRWEASAKRFEAFTVIVGGGSIVVFFVIFFHSPQWRMMLENIILPLVELLTGISCFAVLWVIIDFHCKPSPSTETNTPEGKA